jgi:hypothetical protein
MKDTQHKSQSAYKTLSSTHHNNTLRILFIVMLNIVMLNVIMLSFMKPNERWTRVDVSSGMERTSLLRRGMYYASKMLVLLQKFRSSPLLQKLPRPLYQVKNSTFLTLSPQLNVSLFKLSALINFF